MGELFISFGSDERAITLDFEAVLYLAQEKAALESILDSAIFTSDYCAWCLSCYRKTLCRELAIAGDLPAQTQIFNTLFPCVTRCYDSLLITRYAVICGSRNWLNDLMTEAV